MKVKLAAIGKALLLTTIGLVSMGREGVAIPKYNPREYVQLLNSSHEPISPKAALYTEMGGFHCQGLIPPVQYFLAARASLSSAGVFLTAGPSAGVQCRAEFPTVATIVTSQGVQLFKFVGKLKVSGQPVDGPFGKLFSYSGVLKQTEPVIGPQHSLNVVGAKATEYIIEGGAGSGGGSGGGRNPPGSGLGGGTGPRGPGGF